jgi:hypothetical protein
MAIRDDTIANSIYIQILIVQCLKNIKFMCMRLRNLDQGEVHIYTFIF